MSVFLKKKEEVKEEKKYMTIEQLEKYVAFLLQENKSMKQRLDKIATRLGL